MSKVKIHLQVISKTLVYAFLQLDRSLSEGVDKKKFHASNGWAIRNDYDPYINFTDETIYVGGNLDEDNHVLLWRFENEDSAKAARAAVVFALDEWASNGYFFGTPQGISTPNSNVFEF